MGIFGPKMSKMDIFVELGRFLSEPLRFSARNWCRKIHLLVGPRTPPGPKMAFFWGFLGARMWPYSTPTNFPNFCRDVRFLGGFPRQASWSYFTPRPFFPKYRKIMEI